MKRILEISTVCSPGGNRPWRAATEGRGRAIGKVILVVLVVGLVGCAGFERDWNRALAEASGPETQSASLGSHRRSGVTGAWAGTWRSTTNGHTGELRCLVSEEGSSGEKDLRQPAVDAEEVTTNAFRYRATWGIFSGTFPTRQPVRLQSDGSLRSAGTWTLPAWAGGRYDFDILIRGDQWNGQWKSRRDAGVLEMRRVAGP